MHRGEGMKAGRQRVTGRELGKEGENKRVGEKKQCDRVAEKAVERARKKGRTKGRKRSGNSFPSIEKLLKLQASGPAPPSLALLKPSSS